MRSLDDPLHDREIGVRDSTVDTTRIDDVRIGAVRPLITPALLQERVPVRDETLALVEHSRAAGFDVHLTKPLDSPALAAAIASLTPPNPLTAPPPLAPLPPLPPLPRPVAAASESASAV